MAAIIRKTVDEIERVDFKEVAFLTARLGSNSSVSDKNPKDFNNLEKAIA